MYKVTGLGNHRQRESFFPSYKFVDFEGIKTTVLNSDVTGTNDYSIVIFEADTKEKIEEALEIIRRDLTLDEVYTDEEIENEVRSFDKYHVIDLGDYIISIEVEEEEEKEK